MLKDNLPGINVTLKDGGLIIPEKGDSEPVLIIAPSLMKDAPEEPVRVRSSVDLITQGFGDFYIGGELNPIAVEWKAAIDGGAKVVYLVALKEITAERAEFLEQNAINEYVAAGGEKVNGEAKYKDVLTAATELAATRRKFIYYYDLMMGDLLDFSVSHVVVTGVNFEDEVNRLDKAFFPEVQNIEDFPNIPGIVISSEVIATQAINYPVAITLDTNDTLSLKVGSDVQTIKLDAKTYDGETLTIKDLGKDIEKKLADHTTSINARVVEENGSLVFYFEDKVSVDSATTADFLNLKGETELVRTPAGLIIKGSFSKTLADYCETKTLMKQATIGYVGIKGPIDTKVSTVRKHVEKIANMTTEMSPYLQIVGSQTGVTVPGTNSIYFTNGASHYAALVSTLPPESATTNKELSGVPAIRFDYSLRQLSQLTEKKIVTFRIKDGTRLVVTDGVTSAPDILVAGKRRPSDYTRLSTLRITQLATEVVREAVDPYIGEPNEIPQYNSINTAIKSALEKIREAGAIRGYSFSITNVTARLDHAVVLLSVVPAFELRRVDVEVNLTTSDTILDILSNN